MVDDAAMFPPGNANADVALAEHLCFRRCWFADLIGPLLIPVRAWDAFVQAHQDAGAPAVSVVLIGTTTVPSDVPDPVTVTGFEIAVADAPLPSIPEGRSLAVEIGPGSSTQPVLAGVAAGRACGYDVVAKFRTGGIAAEAFPSVDVLADVLFAANAVPVPLKLTAGLHHAVRNTDPGTGFTHHGFLNVLVAVARTLAGADRPAVAAALSWRETEPLVSALRGLDATRAKEVRGRFVSFGCCGVEDPVNDLARLGLVDSVAEERR